MTRRLRPDIRRILSILAFLPVIAASPFACGAEAEHRPPPWHLVDIWWDMGQEFPFESFSIDVTISNDVPGDVNLYIAPVGLAKLSGTSWYGGLQTNADGYTKTDRRLRVIGRGLIFSMWGERSLDAIRPSLGGFCQSSGHEGDFISVRRQYAWKPGRYTYKLTKKDREVIDGKPHTWVGAFVVAPELDEHVFIGAMRFPGENLVLGRNVANFVEIYGRRIPLSKIPRTTVTFSNLQVNGQTVVKPKASAIYPARVPDYAEARGENGAVVIEVGREVDDRTRRRVSLIGG